MQLQERVQPIKIEEEMTSSYLDYAMSVIVSRALPDVRDGLKPVHRRILYAVEELGLGPASPYKKSARIVGEVLGKFHPHGDTAVYDAMVRLAQDFSLRYPLIQGQGNFGSMDNDPPAAMRYTEARLSLIAQEMLADIDQDTVDFTPNFDGSLAEPTVLPARLPNLLVNGSAGIAVGMATSIPPHNLAEVCDGVRHLLEHPEATVEALLRIISGPDFPTGGLAYGGEGWKSLTAAYSTGHGRIVVKARASVEEAKGRASVIITELPYQVNKASLVERIAELAREHKVPGIAEVRDESDRQGLRIVVELKREAQPEVVLKNLYERTSMKLAFYINILALVEGQPRTLGLKACLQHYINHRREVIGRRTRFQLERAQEREHILRGLLLALERLDWVIAAIRRSQDGEAARQALMADFGLSQAQAQAILEMPLRRLAALERQKLSQEHADLERDIVRFQGILAEPRKVDDLIREDMAYLKKKFGDHRRTQVLPLDEAEPADEDLIHPETVAVLLSQRGYIKRVPIAAFRLQIRGGRGATGMTTREADALQHLVVANTRDSLLFFTERGRVFQAKCYKLPADASRASRGVSLINLVSLDPGERVMAMAAVPEFDRSRYLVLATRRGQVKRTPLSHFSSVKSPGLVAIKLKPKDALASAQIVGGGDEIVLATSKGYAARFPASAIPSQDRTAQGVRGVRLEEGDEMVALEVAGLGHLFTLTAQGYGKRTPLDSYPVHRRGARGVSTFRLTARTGPLVAARVVHLGQDVLVISAAGVLLRTGADSISSQGRITQGVSIMKLDEGDEVVAVATLDDQGLEKETRKAEAGVRRRRASPPSPG